MIRYTQRTGLPLLYRQSACSTFRGHVLVHHLAELRGDRSQVAGRLVPAGPMGDFRCTWLPSGFPSKSRVRRKPLQTMTRSEEITLALREAGRRWGSSCGGVGAGCE